MLTGFIFVWTALALCETAHVARPPEPTLQAATVTFRDQISSVLSSGVYYQSNGVPNNHTDIRLRIDVDNLNKLECNAYGRDSGYLCDSPNYPAAYRVVCDEQDNPQAIVDRCIGSEQLKLLILCVTESRARELLTGEGLRVAPQRLTVILVNRTADRPCPLLRRVRNGEITASSNISVTVQHSGTCQLEIPPEMHTDTTESRDANLALLALFAIGLIGALVGIWFVAACLKRRFKQCKTPQQEEEGVTNALRRCPAKAYKPPKRKDTNSEEKCAICLEEYQAKVLVRQLMCKHSFHKACIDRWLMDKRTCPLCKQDVVGDYKGKLKEQTPAVHVQRLMERTARRATLIGNVNDLPNQPNGSNEMHVHSPSQQDRVAVHDTEQSS